MNTLFMELKSIWREVRGLFEKDSEQDETVLPEVKKYPPMPPVKEPPVIGEPASLIIKALQDDGLDWEYSTESGLS